MGKGNFCPPQDHASSGGNRELKFYTQLFNTKSKFKLKCYTTKKIRLSIFRQYLAVMQLNKKLSFLGTKTTSLMPL